MAVAATRVGGGRREAGACVLGMGYGDWGVGGTARNGGSCRARAGWVGRKMKWAVRRYRIEASAVSTTVAAGGGRWQSRVAREGKEERSGVWL